MNLFTLELGAVLERLGLTMAVLYSLYTASGAPAIAPSKVARLQRSLTEDISASLSAAEIALIATAFHLDSSDIQRLHAALLGEAIHRLLVGRVSTMSALEESERVIELLMAEGDDQEALHQELLRSARTVRGDRAPSADVNAQIADAIEPAAEACSQGELWLGVALDTPDRDHRDDLLGLAWTALDRAAQLLAVAPTIAQGSAPQSEWRRTVEQALATIRDARA